MKHVATDTGADEAEGDLGRYAGLCFSLYGAHHAMTRAYQPILEPLGLTYPQFLVMAALWTRDGRSVGEIGRAVRLESNTLTPLLKRMESAGLLRRARAKTDERVVVVELTEAGRALEARGAKVPECILEASGLSLAEVDRMSAALDALRASLQGVEPG